MDAAGTFVLVVDELNHALRRIDLASAMVTTVAGSLTQGTGYSDGTGTAAKFNNPKTISMDAAGTFALIVSPRAAETHGLYALPLSPPPVLAPAPLPHHHHHTTLPPV